MKKRVVIFVFALIAIFTCLFGLTACGDSNNGGNVSNVTVTSISLNKTSATLAVGDTLSLTATISPSNATDKSITWRSSSTSVATVSNGVVTAKSSGTTTITAKTSNGKTATCSVTVKAKTIAATSISLNKTSATLTVDETLNLTATISPSNATDKNVTWSSSNTSVATVSNGVVTAKSSGTTTITAKTSNGKTATCSVTVKNKEILPTSIYLSKTSIELEESNTQTLTITILPSNATNKTIEWLVLDTSVATVDNGVVIAVSEGTTTVIATTSNGLTATCTINVTSPFSFVSSGNAYSLHAYRGSVTEVDVPSTYKGKNVVSIGKECFANNFNLVSITLPDTILEISSSAFLNCTSLTNITIPNSVTKIGYAVFNGCSSLAEITIPFVGATTGGTSGSQSLFGYVFGTDSYTGGTAITQTYLDSGFSINNTYYIPNGLRKVTVTGGNITNNAFYNCSSLTSVTIGNGVTSIGSSAFNNCRSLTSITIGNNVTSIGVSAFKDCSSLKNVKIENGSIGSQAFDGCSSLTSVTIGNGVTSIGSGAFNGCSGLREITIPFVGAEAGKTSTDTYQYPFGYIFGTSSYTGGTATKQYFYGSSTTSMTNDTYYIPSSLKKVTVTGGNILCEAFYNCSILISVTIPNSVTSIGRHAFESCSSLTSITIPNSVTSIGQAAFSDCRSLMSVTIGNGVTSIGQAAFLDCRSLMSVTIPDSVTSIGDSAFFGCSSLLSVTIGNSVKSIGRRVFESCYKLVEVINKSSSLTIYKGGSDGYIGYYALNVKTEGESEIVNKDGYLFYTYDNVNYLLGYVGDETSLTLPKNYNGESYKIYTYAFYNCSSLTSVTIPSSVTSIGSSVFYNCSSLKTIYCEAKSKPEDWSGYWNVKEVSSSSGISYYSVVWDYKIK